MVSGAVLWALAIGFGAQKMLRYASTPGRLAAPPQEWPSNSPVHRTPGKPTLLLFVHPECPCSRASLTELSQIMVLRDKLDALVLFLAPASMPQWQSSDLYESARGVPGVQVIQDRAGVIGKRFGAHTSGQVLLYDARGRLVFDGGITAARGHEGDNEGVDSIMAFLQGGTPSHRTAPVFGCSLDGVD